MVQRKHIDTTKLGQLLPPSILNDINRVIADLQYDMDNEQVRVVLDNSNPRQVESIINQIVRYDNSQSDDVWLGDRERQSDNKVELLLDSNGNAILGNNQRVVRT